MDTGTSEKTPRTMRKNLLIERDRDCDCYADIFSFLWATEEKEKRCTRRAPKPHRGFHTVIPLCGIVDALAEQFHLLL